MRNTRCDYFDGRLLAGAPFDDFGALADLAGYLWFTQSHNISGYAILGGRGDIGNASHFYSLCHVETVYGDFGLCDEISVLETRYRIQIDNGAVDVLDDAHLVRSIRGRCN